MSQDSLFNISRVSVIPVLRLHVHKQVTYKIELQWPFQH